MQTKKQKGFTLIEMLVVIGIIGILATMILVSVASIRKNSIDTRRKSNVENVKGASSVYYSVKSEWPPTTNWATLITALSGSGYFSENLPADEDGDATNEYAVSTCTSPCQFKLCNACELATGENCTSDSPVSGDTRKWSCTEVK